jgi:hypothetical protein
MSHEQILPENAIAIVQAAAEQAGLPMEQILPRNEDGYLIPPDTKYYATFKLAAALVEKFPHLYKKVVTNLANFLSPKQPERTIQDHWGARTETARRKCTKKSVTRGPSRYSNRE